MQGLKYVLRYVSRYKWLAVLNVVCNMFTALFSVFSVVMVIPLLQIIFDQVPAVFSRPKFAFTATYLLDFLKYKMSAIKAAEGATTALLYVCVSVVVVILLKNISRYAALRSLSPIRTKVIRDIRNDLYEKLLQLPLSFYSKEKKGNIITRMTDDMRAIEFGIMSMLENMVREPINIIVSLIFMLMISVKLTLFVFGMLLVTGLLIGKISKTLKKHSFDAQSIVGRIVTIVEESISGLRIVQSFTAEKYKTAQFKAATEALQQTNNNINLRFELASPLTEFLSICVFSAVLWFGGSMVLGHELEAASFIGFIAMFSLLIQPAKSFSSAINNINIGAASSERIFELINTPVSITSPLNPVHKKQFNKELVFEDVNFNYTTSKSTLTAINFTVPKGEMVALVGASGSGKTTITDLVSRFYDVDFGCIKIDGVDIRTIALSDLREMIGIVSQEPILFNDTVYNNIAFGISDATPEKVKNAARVANALDFIEKMPEGFDSNIGDRGSRLSGGERQRLTIARAVLKNPPILILDEATSSLDAKSEKLVQEALDELMKDRTTLVIAHRLSTIRHADSIIVLQEGKIAERGNHETLLQQNGIYAKMVALQQFSED